MFQPSTVDVIELSLPQASIDALEADPKGEYQPGTFSIAETDGTPAGIGAFSPLRNVGIRLKGGTGSFEPLSGKAAFKIKFGKTERYLGLKKLTLNNMVQDPSMLHETLAYEAFRAAGVPAVRTGYAYVRVNGEDYGVYLNVETLDDLALEKRFGTFGAPPQHLYEGEYGADVSAGGAGAFEVDEGEETERDDLDALIAAASDGAAPDWSDRVGAVADLEEMTRNWAVEKYIGHWDGYAGQAGTPDLPLPNNYYLYSDPIGRFQMLPWGTDQTWLKRLPFDAPAGLLFDGCLADESCAARYRRSLREAEAAIAGTEPAAEMGELAQLLQPWLAMDPRQPFSPAEVADERSGTIRFMNERAGELDAWLATQPPEPPEPGDPSDPGPPALGAPLADQRPAAPLASPPEATAPRLLRLGRIVGAQGGLSVRLWAPAAGALELRATMATGDGDRTVCLGRARTSGAGAKTLDCRLTATARHHLVARWLRLQVRSRFVPDLGEPLLARREITLPRG
jgi:hypothetical protein